MALLVLILDFMMLRRHMAYNSSVHELARVYSLLRVSLLVLLGMVQFTCCFLVLCLLGLLGIRTCVLGSGLVYVLFVKSLVLSSFFGRLFGVLGELRLLVALVLGLVSGVAGIWIFVVL